MNDPTLVSDAFITIRINAAQDIVNGKIGDMYVLPLASVPNLVAHIALEITVSLILMTQFSEESKDTDKGWKKRMDYAMDMLKKVQKGELKLRDDTTYVELTRSTTSLPQGYPDAASSDPNAVDSTQPKVTMNKTF